MINYDELIASIPQGLTKLEIARYLYIELGRYFIYDPEIIWSEDMEQKRIIADRDIEDVTNNKVVCTSLSRIYAEVLRRVGIDAEMVYIPPEEGNPKDVLGHGYTQINIDGKIGSVALNRDLTNIKVGMQTEYFLRELAEEQEKEAREKGKRETILTLDKETLRRIDEKIGYTLNGMYLDDFIEKLKKQFTRMRTEPKFGQVSKQEWIMYQIECITRIMGHNNLKFNERGEYFKKLIEECIGNDEIDKYYDKAGITCFDTDGKMRTFYVITPKNGDPRIVYEIADGEAISRITQEEINRMLDSGMQILSKTNQEQYLKILQTDPTVKNGVIDISKDIRYMALSMDVMAEMSNVSQLFHELEMHTQKERSFIHDQ